MSGFDAILPEATKKGLVCPECDFILREAVQTANGDRMCFHCFENLRQSKNYKSTKTGISILNDNGEPECHPDNAVRREVSQLVVKCTFVKYGCPWNGQMKDYEMHEKACRYRPQRCPNSNFGCQVVLSPDEVNSHIKEECAFRVVQCRHCGEKMHAKDEEEHFGICPNAPTQCINCSKTMSRNELADHQTNHCSTVVCTCGEKLTRHGQSDEESSMAAHASNPAFLLQHIISLFSFVSTFTKSLSNFQLRLDLLEANQSSGIPHLQDLAAIREEMERKLKLLTERIMPLEQYRSDTDKDRKVNIMIEELRTRNKLLEDKLKSQEQQIRTLQIGFQQQQSYGSDGRQHDSSLVMAEKKYVEIEKQLAHIKVHVAELELQLQASLASTHNGSFLWRIPEMSRRRREAIEGKITSIYSPPFYTGRNGYKMCVRAYLNGDGMGYKSHLSLFFVIMKGEYDPLLKWPFDYKVSLILVDQTHRKHIVNTFKPTPESSSFKKPQSEMNVASGCPTFCKLSYLEDISYVNDDVVFIKCIVDTSRIFHP